MEKFKQCLKDWLTAESNNKYSKESSEKLRALYNAVPEELNFSRFVEKLLNHASWHEDHGYYEIVKWVEQELHIPPKEPVPDETIKQKLALTAEQQMIVSQINSLFQMAHDMGIEIIFDNFEYSFAAINRENIVEFQSEDCETEDAVNIEKYVEWGNIYEDLWNYSSGSGNLYAVFK